jgi:hypothetical protein
VKGALPFVLFIGAYLGFEMFAAHKASYRLEASYSLDQFAAEAEAVARCGAPEPERLARFERTYAAVIRRAEREGAEKEGAGDAAAVAAAVEAQRSARVAEVAEIVAASGCDDPRILTLLKRFEIHARLNVGGPARRDG